MRGDWLKRNFPSQDDGACAHTGAVVRAHTWPVEAVPGEDPNRVYEFAWSFNPLMLKGATGSPGNSVAIS
jgi:hypothetical protein